MRPLSEAGISVEEERRSKIAFVFPGQGTQYVGMGRKLYENSKAARQVYNEADLLSQDHFQEIGLSGFSLSRLSFEGPKKLLDQIDLSPQAILTASVAALAALRERVGQKIFPDYTAGHSLGEYTALVLAGVLDFTNAFRVVQERSIQTKRAVEQSPGAMIAIRKEGIINFLRNLGVEIAAHNSEEDATITGPNEAIQQILKKLEEMKIRFRHLDIGGSFHSTRMSSAREGFRQFLEGIHFEQPRVPIILNKTAQVSTDPEEIKEELADNLISPVQWVQSMRRIAEEGITYIIEIGPQSVLAGLVRKTIPSAVIERITDFQSIQNLDLNKLLTYAGVTRG